MPLQMASLRSDMRFATNRVTKPSTAKMDPPPYVVHSMKMCLDMFELMQLRCKLHDTILSNSSITRNSIQTGFLRRIVKYSNIQSLDIITICIGMYMYMCRYNTHTDLGFVWRLLRLGWGHRYVYFRQYCVNR